MKTQSILGKQTRWGRKGGAEGAKGLSWEWSRSRSEKVSEGGASGCLSQTLTSGDFIPVSNGSGYIKEKKLKFRTFLLHKRGSLSYGCVDQS